MSDALSDRLDHGGSWVRIPSGSRIFPGSQWVLLTFHLICVYHSHIRSLGWLVGRFSDMLYVTARCSYELCCQSLFDSVAAGCSSSQ